MFLPYLPVLGTPPLRFQIPPPPPDLTTHPAAAAPPAPAAMQPAEPPAPAPAGPKPALPTAAHAAPTETPDNLDQAASAPPKAIIPDDVRPAIRPEDFLPYFQIPGSAKLPGDVNLLMPAPRGAPAPAPLPPSSATYTQSK